MSIKNKTLEVLSIRANNVLRSRNDTTASNIGIFFEYLGETPIINSIIQELIGEGLPNFKDIKDEVIRRDGLHFPPVHKEKCRICFSALRYVMDGEEEPWALVVTLTSLQNIDDMATIFLNEFFTPFYTYLVENLVEMDVYAREREETVIRHLRVFLSYSSIDKNMAGEIKHCLDGMLGFSFLSKV